MPWKVADVESHKKGLTDAQKKTWVKIANGRLEDCLADGGEQDACEASAIRIANAALNEAQTIEAEAGTVSIEEQPALPEKSETEFTGDIVPLVETAIRQDGTLPIKIIAPGWGESGFYPPEVLERDGPKTFPAGTHMYWNHPSKSEEKDRPERDLRDLAGVLTKGAYFDANGPAGPGLYGEAKVTAPYRAAVNELAPHIGLSIRAYGTKEAGEVAGKKGPIITQLVAGRSVDYVTKAGAGGKILELFEAAGRNESTEHEETSMNEQEAEALRAQNAELTQEVERLTSELARVQEGLLLRKAQDVALEVLTEIEMPAPTRERIMAAQANKLVKAEDGSLDEAAYRAQVKEAADAEMAYIKEIRGNPGKIVGMGGTATSPTGEGLKESYTRYYRQMGKSREEAEMLAELAAQG